MKKILKITAYILTSIITLIVTSIIAAYFYFASSLPNYDGQVQLAGLSNKVSIIRDKNALPHIIAQSKPDAYFAMGYVHAQDRLWQMHLHRHIASGRLSELVGINGLNTDKFIRNLGIFEAAKKAYPLLSQATKTKLEAYSKGVNAYLAEAHVLPIEFTILQLDKPKPWQPIDSVAWMKIMAWDLNATWRKELDRLKLSANFTPQQIAELHPPYPGDKPFTPPDPQQLYGFKLKRLSAKTPHQDTWLAQLVDNQTIEGIGSNNWVISGNKTISSKPILANDPHLALTAPALWYHAHIQSQDGLNTIGSTMPGVPFIILGRTDKIAWGFTNSDPDAQDLYVEKITKPGFYKTPNGEAPFITRKEVIKIKGQDDYILNVRATRHGPVISDQLSDITNLLGKEHVLSMRWTALDNDSKTLDAAAELAEANNWQEFKAALKNFKAPQQSIVYADIDGNIGFYAPGAVPIRHPDNSLNGQYPSPGWLAQYDWQGYIPFKELPQAFNPKQGYIATANHKFVDANYKYHIASKWSLPYRYQRIAKLLEKTPKHTMQTSTNIQLDQFSNFLQTIRPLLMQALTQTTTLNQQSIQALELIKNWDGRATVNSNEVLILTLWLHHLQKAILAPDFNITKKTNHLFLINVLSNKHGMRHWCKDKNSETIPQINCTAIVAQSLKMALDQLNQQLGKNMQQWHWGDVHQSFSKHRIFDNVELLKHIFNIVTPVGGSKFTINVASTTTTNSKQLKQIFKVTHGPSLRHMFDLSNLENSKYIHSSGQSGNIFSNHYRDYNPIWANGDFLPMTIQKANYLPSAIGTLTLTPK